MAFTLKNKGLNTYGNELIQPDGTLDIALNVIIDEDDTLQPRRGFKSYTQGFGLEEDRIKQLIEYKKTIIAHYTDKLALDNGSGTFTNFSGSYSELTQGLRIKYIEANSNLYLTTSTGIKKISAKNQAALQTSTITNAGGIKAVEVLAKVKYELGGFMPPQSKVAYRIVWGTKDNNNNLILGSPSSRFVLQNSSKDVNINEVFKITVNTTTIANTDYILLSSTETDYFIWFNVSGSDTAPQNSDTLGRTAIEAKIKNVTTSEDAGIIANAVANLSDFYVTLVGSVITIELTSAGDVTDPTTNNVVTFTVGTDEQGSVTSGQSANTLISFTIPAAITTDYFYQIYRSAVVELPEGLELDEIDPGDELNLVYESPVTDADISAGEIVDFEDNTPESFRAAGVPLYTNPVTGQGILQSNEAPPISTDIALFRGSTFYANTKSLHRLQINLLSVLGYTSGNSEFIIGNNTIVRNYTFVGQQEVTSITCDTYANTTADSVILINSANDERKYYLWFDKGAGTDPAISERIGVRVNIKNAITAADISLTLANTIDLLDDFSAVDNTGSVTVTNYKNGNTTDASLGSPSPGGSWAVTVTTQGDGEDSSLNEVLLSNQISVSQAIDETARSLVKVINKDASSPVNAYYLSGPDDVPGIILLENRSLEDNPFYLATNDAVLTTKFNPELPLIETITSISVANPTVVTAAGHGLVTGDSILIYDTDSTPAINGVKEVTVLDANTFSVPVQVFNAGTTGYFFKTDTASDNEVSPNRIFFSKTNQPEAVPLVNYIDIGPKDKEILRIIALRDNLFVLKEDGFYVITGASAPNFTYRLIDGSSIPLSPDSAVVLNNLIYCLTNDGVVTASETGVEIISRPIEDRINRIINSRYDYKLTTFGLAYRTDKSYLLWMPSSVTDTVATQCYRYNTFTDSWTRWDVSATCGLINSSDDKAYLGDGSENVILQERKNQNRTDYSDKEYTLTLPVDSIAGTTLSLSSVSNLKIGDVIYQEQYITIAGIRRVLRKLDFDNQIVSDDYEDSVLLYNGMQMNLALDIINAKLVADGIIVTPITFSTNFTTQRDEFNNMIDELNDINSGTQFKDYAKFEDIVPLETWVTNVITKNNTIEVLFETPFIQGEMMLFKGIKSDVQYSPQHFGDPSVLKQVREGTIIFDQNNFYEMEIGYATDLQPNFEFITVPSVGVGDWGLPFWGDGYWGGDGADIPIRTYIPLEKQRCRYLTVRIKHNFARESYRIIGVSLEPRALSKRGYR